jgi:hypothetical protein
VLRTPLVQACPGDSGGPFIRLKTISRCHVTARNAGGRFTDSSSRIGDLLIGS